MKADKRRSLWLNVDWVTIVIYLALVLLGWISICGASYDFEQSNIFFNFGDRSGMQIIWIVTSLILGGLILLTDERWIESFSYLIYIGFVVLLFVTPFLARDIKGSLSWIKIGSFSIQPAEFAKFGTALCVAKIISSYNLELNKWKDFLLCSGIVILPLCLIILQKETGSALVYLSFFLMMYRQGMPGSLLFAGVSAVIYFVIGIRFADDPLLGMDPISLGEFAVFLLIQFFTCMMLYVYTEDQKARNQLTLVSLIITGISVLISKYLFAFNVTWIQLGICICSIIYLIYLSIKNHLLKYIYIASFALGSLLFHYSTHYMLNNLLEPHQQTRVRVLLGLEDDPRGAGYNVIQAKVAIGSGGLQGKGFLNGTQTKLNYVPEQVTDFIFCTVGEEEGFIGCVIVLLLFLTLILRIIHLSERQPYVFGRVYGYCVMSIILFHVFINIGMVLGITPVIGIPLPFFSYGGSSLWGFTILLFFLLRIDASRTRGKG